ncbi:MAG TPA: SAF domain-containing protein [Gemmatimonadales bacterium]|nr:SAF domain-containing protein [Gemmatimonadales bacterium]
MIIVDRALRRLEEEGKPLKVAMVGAGFMARGIANQIVNSVPGLRLSVIANRTLANAVQCYAEAGVTPSRPRSLAELEDAIRAGRPSVCDDFSWATDAEGIDCVVEVTGAVEFGAQVILRAIEHGHHVVTMNAEVDGTVGSILKAYADRQGVILSGSDGDQPGVEMNLYRFVRGIGLTPLVMGNIKGLQDPYRTPETQRGFAEKWGQRPEMVTSFADGTKMCFEQAIVANATGMRVLQRGMSNGLEWPGHVDELTKHYDIDTLRSAGGIVDYVVGAKPWPGVYCMAAHDDSKQRHYLNLYKLGEGPLYSFYTPYHLCHFELPFSVARVVLFGDPVLQPLAGPCVEVVTVAKTDLAAGTTLDGIGGYHTFGTAENAAPARSERLLPMGQSEGAVLRRAVKKDAVLTYDDVTLPAGRLVDRLRAEQDARFPVPGAPVAEPVA